MGPTNWDMVLSPNLETLGQTPTQPIPNLAILTCDFRNSENVRFCAKFHKSAIKTGYGQYREIRDLLSWSLAQCLQVWIRNHIPIRWSHGGVGT